MNALRRNLALYQVYTFISRLLQGSMKTKMNEMKGALFVWELFSCQSI